MTNKTFHDRLRELIDEFGEGEQKKLAAKLGVNKSLPGAWLKRGSLPSGETLVAFRDQLGISTNWLLYGTGPKYLSYPGQAAEPVVKEGGGEYSGGKKTLAELDLEEGEYVLKLLNLMRNKDAGVRSLIMRDIDALTKTPDVADKKDKKKSTNAA